VTVLGVADQCRIGDKELRCSDVPAHLKAIPSLSVESPIGVVWGENSDSDDSRVLAVVRDLSAAGFRRVAYVTIRKYCDASSTGDC
jgi:hypothetical protein